METDKIKNILLEKINSKEIYIKKDGTHFEITVISEQFNNLNQVERHQIIYSSLKKYITDHSIHSLSIKPYTIYEWKNYKELNII